MKQCIKRAVPKIPKIFSGRSMGTEGDRSGMYTFWDAAFWDSLVFCFIYKTCCEGANTV